MIICITTSDDGRLTKVNELKLITNDRSYDQSARPIEELLNELAKEVPQEEWDNLPNDLNANLDHYLYGVPKK